MDTSTPKLGFCSHFIFSLCYSGEQVYVTVPSCFGRRDQKCVEAFTRLVLAEDRTGSSENTQDGDEKYSTEKYYKRIVTNFLFVICIHIWHHSTKTTLNIFPFVKSSMLTQSFHKRSVLTCHQGIVFTKIRRKRCRQHFNLH